MHYLIVSNEKLDNFLLFRISLLLIHLDHAGFKSGSSPVLRCKQFIVFFRL